MVFFLFCILVGRPIGGSIAPPPPGYAALLATLRYGRRPKKGLGRKLKCFSLSNLGEELGLFRLIIQRSNLDGGTPKISMGGH